MKVTENQGLSKQKRTLKWNWTIAESFSKNSKVYDIYDNHKGILNNPQILN